MTSNIVNLFGRRGPTIANANPYDGSCPHCGDADVMFNIGPDHWVVCHAHKTKWRIGSNLYSSWRDQTEADWTRNSYLLSTYMTVKPIFPAAEHAADDRPLDDPLPPSMRA